MSFERCNEKFFLGKYKIDSDGYINVGEISRGEMNRQSKSVGSFIDKLDPDCPFLGEGLRFLSVFNKNGQATGNYNEYRIHMDDAEKFIGRIKNFYGDK